jgi:hypothetical protein
MLAIDNAGGDGIDIDAVLDEIEPRRLSETDDGRLAGAIDGDQGLAAPSAWLAMLMIFPLRWFLIMERATACRVNNAPATLMLNRRS